MSSLAAPARALNQVQAAPAGPTLLQRACACGQHAMNGECEQCKKKGSKLQRRAFPGRSGGQVESIPSSVYETLRTPGSPLDAATRAYMEPRFGHDFSRVRVHTGERAAESARAVGALAYTVGHDVVFGAGQFQPSAETGRHLLAHELTHTIQQGGAAPGSISGIESETAPTESAAEASASAVLSGGHVGIVGSAAPGLHRRAAPYIKKISVHLAPSQSADLEWEGTPPSSATGSDHFTVSTGKGYSDPGDPAGTCTRDCCRDADTQCAPPWNRPDKVGACCTFYGNDFWTGVPEDEHNGWLWWTPIQPYYSSRGIALHQHTEVTGQPIGHGCVRMEEGNAKRIYDYSNGRRTNVSIDGRAAPVLCEESRKCGGASSSGGGRGASLESESIEGQQFAQAETQEAVPGLEGELT